MSLSLVLSLMVPASGQEGEQPRRTSSPPSGFTVRMDDGGRALSLDGGAPFHRTANDVIDDRLIDVPGSSIRLALWTEVLPDEQTVPFYAISLDGRNVATVRPTSYALKLRHGDFDPALRAPRVEASLAAHETTNLYIVQFVTQPLEAFRKAIEDSGGAVRHFLANHAHIVEMSREVRDQVAAMPFVRSVRPYHPAYRLEEVLLEEIRQFGIPTAERRYHIQVVRPGPDQKNAVADRIRAIGGKIEVLNPSGCVLDATLEPQQLLEVVRMDEVFFIDRWFPRRTYMNNVREDGGANHVEAVGGYTGEGVRGEVLDSGVLTSHPAFQARPPIIHNCNNSDTWHGTATYGINFGDGTGNADGRGLVPDAQGIASSVYCLGDRYQHTMELVQDPYYAVYQTNSWGSCCTTEYGTDAEEMDRIIFDTDLLILQAQANEGSRNSDVSAWAKNVVSVGGIRHYDTLLRTDDQWSYAGSIGPAADGRVKPDLAYWYDYILTTSDDGGYMTGFGGTSAATPETAGHFGLFFQMWADGIFGNEVDPGGTVFDNRCHMSTAKAVMINTARQYAFGGTGHDLARVHQGWGTANVGYLYDMRDKISILDETEVLGNMESVSYVAYVEPGEPAMRVTMVYTDPPGTTSSSQHRINDLTLKVTSPSEVIYWGNNGLLEGNWSTPGGDPNTIDTVENVFVENPETGVWTVEVIASEVNQDSHVETPELDADFALVVSGGSLATCTSEGRIGLDAARYTCTDQATIRVVDCDLNTDDGLIETVTVTIDSTTEPAGESVLLTETGPVTGDFRGTIDLNPVDAPGVLHVSEADVVTATYIDEDDGQGGVNVAVTDTAVVDCTPPQISNVQTTDIQAWSATVTFATDEPARGTVHYGLDCSLLSETAAGAGFRTDHTIDLAGLDDDTAYFYTVEAEDEAGNVTFDDNGGSCYTFTTPEAPDYFTEEFSGDFDLVDRTVTFAPDGSISFYLACVEEATGFPTDPAGGTVLSLADDGYVEVALGGGATIPLYDASHSSFYVGSNGYLTFIAGDSEYWPTVEGHFSLPRISGLFVDLNPSSGGTITWKQLADHVAVTWQDVPEYGTSNSNNFQIEMFFDGIIRISWLWIDATYGISGLSEGKGSPSDFAESDLSAYGVCDCLSITPGHGLSSSGYEGGPFTPQCATYTLTNNCDSPLDWTAAGTQAWLDVSPAGGILAPGNSTPVDVCINANANSLPPDTYTDTVTLTNTTSGVAQARHVTLEVVAIPGEIEVTDSIADPYDLDMSFGEVLVGASRTEQITITNTDTVYDLLVTDILLMAGAYLEDFNDGLAQGWEEILETYWEVTSGEYRAAAGALETQMQSLYTGGTWDDCSAEAVMRRTGSMSSAVRIAVRASDDFSYPLGVGSAYVAAISGDGSYYVGKYVSGTFSFIQTWTSSPLLNTDTAPNVVTISVEGTAIDVYLNDGLAWSGTDGSISGLGRIGVLAWSGSGSETVHFFDDVVVGAPISTYTGVSDEQQWYNEHGYEGGVAESAPEGWKALIHPGLSGAIHSRSLDTLQTSTADFRLENLPVLPVVVPPLGSLNFDVVYAPSTVGAHDASVIMESNDADEPSVSVALAGTGTPDDLAVTPADGFESAGEEGGPFEPQCKTYTLTNNGALPLDWTAAGTQAWLDVSPAGGTLAPGNSTLVGVCINANANSLEPGVYRDTVAFSNLASGAVQLRAVALTVLGPCLPPPEPANPSPTSGATGVSVDTNLSWSGSASIGVDRAASQDDCPTTYDVYFGEDVVPVTLVCEGTSSATCDPGTLDSLTTYYWRVVAKRRNVETPGPTWSFTTGCPASDPPGAEEPSVVPKNRYASFVPANAGQMTALRVTLTDLPDAFAEFEGETRWVDTARQISESSGDTGPTPPPTFMGAVLTCDPVYRDWGTVGLVHVYGDAVVPGARYDVRAIDEACDVDVEGDYSPALTVITSMWGDVVGDCAVCPCTQPDADVDFDDIAAVVDKFRNLPCAPIKARADMAPDTPEQLVDFTDIPRVVEAFRSLPYPFDGPSECPFVSKR